MLLFRTKLNDLPLMRGILKVCRNFVQGLPTSVSAPSERFDVRLQNREGFSLEKAMPMMMMIMAIDSHGQEFQFELSSLTQAEHAEKRMKKKMKRNTRNGLHGGTYVSADLCRDSATCECLNTPFLPNAPIVDSL